MNFENWPVNTQLFDAPTDSVCLDEYGRVFVDRDPTYFRMIVTQLLDLAQRVQEDREEDREVRPRTAFRPAAGQRSGSPCLTLWFRHLDAN